MVCDVVTGADREGGRLGDGDIGVTAPQVVLRGRRWTVTLSGVGGVAAVTCAHIAAEGASHQERCASTRLIARFRDLEGPYERRASRVPAVLLRPCGTGGGHRS